MPHSLPPPPAYRDPGAQGLTADAPGVDALLDDPGALRAALSTVTEAVVAVDEGERVGLLNPAACRLLGWSADEARGRALVEVVRPWGELEGAPPSGMRSLLDLALSAESPRPLSLVVRSGDRREVEIAACRLPAGADRGAAVIMVLRDVTERVHLEERMARADRLASLGTMAAGLGHEINNPLAYVVANVAFALDAVDRLLPGVESLGESASALGADLAELREALAEAAEGGDRVRRIVGDLRRLTRGDASAQGAIALRDVLDAAVRMTHNTVEQVARLRRRDEPVPEVAASEAQLVQIFTNLLMNAAQAIPEGEPARNRVEIVTRTDERGFAVVEVSDTGAGIDPEHLPRIFDPFFSTKTAASGMGLGLAIVRQVVESLGGLITVESERGRGTTFQVQLPPARGPALAAREQPAGDAPTAAEIPRMRVLIVDDEEHVARALARIVRQLHDVTIENEPHDALRRFRQGERFDLVFCDVMMPALAGWELQAEVAAIDEEQARRVVFLTGGAITPRATLFLEQTPNRCLLKPFSAAAVAEAIAEFRPRTPA